MEGSNDGSINIELNNVEMKQELMVELTRGQVLVINEFLANNLQPKGYGMTEFAYDLFTRLRKALDTPTKEPFMPEMDETPREEL